MTSKTSFSADPLDSFDSFDTIDRTVESGGKRETADKSQMAGGLCRSSGEGCAAPLPGAGFLTRQRELFKQRLWPAALTFLGFFLFNIAAAATVLINTAQSASSQNLSAAQKTASLLESSRILFGLNSPCAHLIAFPLAAILAIEGFSWMDSRREVDFYESLPVPRRQRFWDICLSGFLYYLFSSLITLEAGLLIAGAMGALTRGILLEIVLQFLRMTAFFLAIYGLGVLSAMLTGNVVVSVCAFFVLLLYELVFKLVLRGYCSQFLSTWSGRPSGFLITNIFDPFFHYNDRVGGAEGPLRLLALAAVYFFLARVSYRLRKNERAGTAVVFGPVRSVVRVAVSLITGLVAGLVFSSLQDASLLSVLWMVLFTVITACIMQIIYEYDFKALFHRPAEIAVAALLALIIYLGFFFDIAGYDRFTPDPGKVADAALVFSDTYSYDPLLNERGESVDRDSFGEEYMHLQNVEDVIAIAAFGQEYTRKSDALHGRDGLIRIDSPLGATAGSSSGNGSSGSSASSGSENAVTIENNAPFYNCTVIYRMKKGENIARTFRLPCSVDPAAMNAVVATKAWREGSFSLYHDDLTRLAADCFTIDYTNAMDYLYGKMDRAKYEAFRQAYQRDLEQFSYSFALENRPVGRLTLTFDSRLAAAAASGTPALTDGTGSRDPASADPSLADGTKHEEYSPAELADAALKLQDAAIGYPVYSTFTNTIAFLKDNGLWLESLDYSSLPLWKENLTKEEQDLIDRIDFSILSGPFCLPEN